MLDHTKYKHLVQEHTYSFMRKYIYIFDTALIYMYVSTLKGRNLKCRKLFWSWPNESTEVQAFAGAMCQCCEQQVCNIRTLVSLSGGEWAC